MAPNICSLGGNSDDYRDDRSSGPVLAIQSVRAAGAKLGHYRQFHLLDQYT